MSIDHRAAALELLDAAIVGKTFAPDDFIAAAQVHATLAAGIPVADQHVSEALARYKDTLDRVIGERDELRAAVREALDTYDPERPGVPHMISGESLDRLHALIGGAS